MSFNSVISLNRSAKGGSKIQTFLSSSPKYANYTKKQIFFVKISACGVKGLTPFYYLYFESIKYSSFSAISIKIHIFSAYVET